MSVTLETYRSQDGLDAEIRISKGDRIPELLITDEGRTIYSGFYSTRQTARRALHRFADSWRRA